MSLLEIRHQIETKQATYPVDISLSRLGRPFVIRVIRNIVIQLSL